MNKSWKFVAFVTLMLAAAVVAAGCANVRPGEQYLTGPAATGYATEGRVYLQIQATQQLAAVHLFCRSNIDCTAKWVRENTLAQGSASFTQDNWYWAWSGSDSRTGARKALDSVVAHHTKYGTWPPRCLVIFYSKVSPMGFVTPSTVPIGYKGDGSVSKCSWGSKL